MIDDGAKASTAPILKRFKRDPGRTELADEAKAAKGVEATG
jgi:hypothetical protein